MKNQKNTAICPRYVSEKKALYLYIMTTSEMVV